MLRTEMRNENTMHIDQMSIRQALEVIHKENEAVMTAIDAAMPEIEKACQLMTQSLQNGGRVFYVGCGTSGRLGVLDAAECPPTYGVSPDTFIGVIAGGEKCLVRAAENAEDRAELAIADLKARNLCEKDIVVGISAAGGAAYVIGALEYASSLHAATVSLSNNPDTPISKIAQVAICADTGPEAITGSTRMKAGTAQKLILNMLSTVSMVQCGHVYENLMINLKPSNIKLKNRMIGIVQDILHTSRQDAEARLENAGWVIREAIK
ncbi:MAG: N-acetylmuramic acid 6-phosphate etherase [Clostridia bacterium]|nr:N-acetylmuramic acid 6-phosphate etherase [Clostridia bacterium]